MEFSMSVVESGIRSDFLNPANYKATLEFASKRNESYLRYCKIIQTYYAIIKNMTTTINEKIKPNAGGGLRTCAHFRQFLLKFMGILAEVSAFKVQFYEKMEEDEEDPVKKPTYDLLSKAGQYSAVQESYKDIYTKLTKA
jgi:hypothetical protein